EGWVVGRGFGGVSASVLVGDGFGCGRGPPPPPPPLVRGARKAFMAGGLAVGRGAPPVRSDGGETLDGGPELHALVGREGFRPAHEVLAVTLNDDRRPAAGPGIPGAGAVGVDDDVGGGEASR